MASNSGHKLARNAPCWCGSGKKYKKCHLSHDEAEGKLGAPIAAGKVIESITPYKFESPSLSPDEDAEESEGRRFKKADLNKKITFFFERLESKRLAVEDAFDAYLSIRDDANPLHDPISRANLKELIERLHRDLPEAYRDAEDIYIRDLIKFAITDMQWESLPKLLDEFGQIADRKIDTFFEIIKMLLYHGQIKSLFAAMKGAWKRVQASNDITDWGINEFYQILIRLYLYQYLETTRNPSADAPELLEGIRELGGISDKAWLTKNIQYLTKSTPSDWRVEDFGESVDADTLEGNVYNLLSEFMADQRHRYGIPFSRSNLFTEGMHEVLHQQGSIRESKGWRKSQRKFKSKEIPAKASLLPLVPDYKIFDSILASDFHLLGSDPYSAGTIIELLPAYLYFITRFGLIHPTEMDEALETFKPLSGQMLNILNRYDTDVHLIQAVEKAWSGPVLKELCSNPALAAARSSPITYTPTLLTASEPQAYRFKVAYGRDVWFSIEMGGDHTLDDLHGAIQRAADFDNDHLYAFFLSGKAWDRTTEYGIPDNSQSSQIKIKDLRLRMKQRFLYIFDFGDGHRFDVKLMAADSTPFDSPYPKIVESHGKMPPQYPDYEDEE